MAYTGRQLETKLYDVFTKEEAIQNSTPSAVSDKENTSTGYFDLPSGTTAQRPALPEVGYLRYNTSLDQAEQYTTDGWQGISAPPIITNSTNIVLQAADDPQTVSIVGQYFDVGASAVLVGADSTVYTPTTSVRNNASSITITYSGVDTFDGTEQEPLTIKVVNGSGISATLEGIVYINEAPIFTQAVNTTVATVIEDEAMSSATVLVTDPDNDALSLSVTSGALPSGIAMSTGGIITGTPNVNDTYNASGVQHNFTVTADDGTTISSRAFNILRKWRDGTSVELFSDSAASIYSINSSATNGYYYIRNYGSGTPQLVYCDFTTQGGPWTIPVLSGRTNSEFSANGPTAIAHYLSIMQAIGIGTPGRGMESFNSTTQVYGAWLAVKRFIWDNHPNFWNGANSSGGVLLMPVLNINGEGGTSDHRTVYNSSYGTHIPPNQDGDSANANQLFCGRWAGTDVSSWETNNFSIPAAEDWGPTNPVDTSYNDGVLASLAVFGIYK